MNPQDWKDVGALSILGMLLVGSMLFGMRKIDSLLTSITEMRVEMKEILGEIRVLRGSLHNFRNKLIDIMKLPKGDGKNAD